MEGWSTVQEIDTLIYSGTGLASLAKLEIKYFYVVLLNTWKIFVSDNRRPVEELKFNFPMQRSIFFTP